MTLAMNAVGISLLILNYQHVENFMIVHLFKIGTRDKKNEFIQLPKCSNFKDFFCDLFPSKLKCFCCKKRGRNHRALDIARD